MSTLVKIAIGVVLNFLQSGDRLSNEFEIISQKEVIECEYTLDQLNPHYIITSEEMLAQNN